MVNSATAFVGASGVFRTLIPSLFAMFKSTLSRPVPTLAITFSDFADCKTFAVSGSKPAISPTVFVPIKSMAWSSVRRVANGLSLISIPALLRSASWAKLFRLKLDVVINTCKVALPIGYR